jgi:hypothetical protein
VSLLGGGLLLALAMVVGDSRSRLFGVEHVDGYKKVLGGGRWWWDKVRRGSRWVRGGDRCVIEDKLK